MEDEILLNVRPSAQGWLVDWAGAIAPLMFHSGAKAEAQAHALAQCIAAIGHDARILVHDRAHQVVGSAHYFAAELRP